MKLLALAYALMHMFSFRVIYTTPQVASDALGSNKRLQKRVPHPTSLPTAGISKTYSHGETDDCLEIKIPATIWHDAGIAENEISWFTLKLSVQVTVDVQALGFLRNGCSFEDTRDNLKGCRFDGDLRTNKQGHLNQAYQLGVSGGTVHGCFNGPLQAASIVTPITLSLSYFVKWYDPATDGG